MTLFIERFLILLALSALLATALPLWRRRWQRRLARAGNYGLAEALGALALARRPAVLYFATATCSQCRLQQAPILAGLAETWGDRVQVRRVDALERDDLAQLFGIITAPSTVVLDAAQRPVAVNHGLAAAERLQAQVQPLLEVGAGGRQELLAA